MRISMRLSAGVIAVALWACASGSVAGQEMLWAGRNTLEASSPYRQAAVFRRKLCKHDIITILVQERLSTSSDAKLETEKDTSNEYNIRVIPQFDFNDPELIRPITLQVPNFSAGDRRKYDGDGEYERKEEFTTRLAAEVEAVLPNGNALIIARRRQKKDDEEHLIILTGIIRPEDVDERNTIRSESIADLHLEIRTAGAITSSSKRGWLTKFLDVINPF